MKTSHGSVILIKFVFGVKVVKVNDDSQRDVVIELNEEIGLAGFFGSEELSVPQLGLKKAPES